MILLNFLVDLSQLNKLNLIVAEKYPNTEFPVALKLFGEGESLKESYFNVKTINEIKDE